MESPLQHLLLIGLAAGGCWLALRRYLDSDAPRWAKACRLCLLAGCVGWGLALLAGGAVAFAAAPLLLWLAFGALAYRAFRPGVFVPGDSCGSARFCDAIDLLFAGALDFEPGLLLGIVPGPDRRQAIRWLFRAGAEHAAGVVLAFLAAWRKRLLWVRLPGVVHSATFSPSGAGKTSGLVIPHLLTDADSAVVIDVSGEIFAATAASRRARGHEIVVLDPAGVTGVKSGALNPLAGLDPTRPDVLDRCRAIADALVVKTGNEHDPHWAETSVLFIGAVIAWVVWVTKEQNRPDLCHLGTVADILADQKELDAAMAGLQKEPALGGMLARLGHKLGHAVDRERGSILSTIGRTLAWLDTPAVAAVISHATFDPEDLRKKKMTVYLVIPPEQLREKAGLVRVWLTTLLWGCVRGGVRPGRLVHFLLDEYAALGSKLTCVEDALTQYRKYKVRLHFQLQGIGQLESSLSEGMDKTLLGNCTLIFLGVADLETLKYVSERCGTTTVATSQRSAGGNWSSGSDSQGTFNRSSGGNDGTSISEAGRPLVTPDEVAGLGDRWAVVFTPNLPPLICHPIRHYEPAFQDAPCGDGRSGVAGVRRACVAFLVAGLAAAAVTLWVASQLLGGARQ